MTHPMRKVYYIDIDFSYILLGFAVLMGLLFLADFLYIRVWGKRQIARAAQMEIAPGITLGEGVAAYFDYDVNWSFVGGAVTVLAYGKPREVCACFSVKPSTGKLHVTIFSAGEEKLPRHSDDDALRDALFSHLIQAVREQRGESPS